MKLLFLFMFLFPNLVFAYELKLDSVVIHYTYSEEMTLEMCDEWHQANGWTECGYNFILDREGNLITARGYNQVGAHAKGFNFDYLGVAFVGMGDATEKQLSTFKENFGHYETIVGHKDLAPTLCPGNVLEQVKNYDN